MEQNTNDCCQRSRFRLAFFCRALHTHCSHSGKAFLSDYQRTRLPFLIHKVLLQPRTWEESKAKQNQAPASPDPRWAAGKNLILFCELVVSFLATAPNSKSGAIPQGQLAARAFPQPLESGTLRAAVCGGLSGPGPEQECSREPEAVGSAVRLEGQELHSHVGNRAGV